MKKILLIFIVPFLSFGGDCIDNLNAEAYCNENLNYIDFNFDYDCDCGTAFNVVGSGQSFGPFEYGQNESYTLGPFSDEDMMCELIVQFCENDISAETWGWCNNNSWVGCEEEEEGCWEDGEFYCIGCELFLNDCEYIECEGPQNWSDVVTIEPCGEGCWEDGEFYDIGSELFLDADSCTYIWCEGDQNWSDVVTIPGCGGCDTVYIEIPVIEYVEVIVTDTVIEYQDVIITEYIDCDTGLPCIEGISEIIEQSKTDGKLYDLSGQEIIRRGGIYIEGGEIKYRLQ